MMINWPDRARGRGVSERASFQAANPKTHPFNTLHPAQGLKLNFVHSIIQPNLCYAMPPSNLYISSIRQHILDRAEVFGRNMLLELLLRQPLEIAQPKQIVLEIRLSGHDARFHKESLLALRSCGCLFVEERFDDVVACWDMAYNPSVHV